MFTFILTLENKQPIKFSSFSAIGESLAEVRRTNIITHHGDAEDKRRAPYPGGGTSSRAAAVRGGGGGAALGLGHRLLLLLHLHHQRWLLLQLGHSPARLH